MTVSSHFHGAFLVNESPPEPPDEELIAAMGRQNEDLETAKAAFRIFFHRHRDYMIHHTRRVNARLAGYGLGVEDVVQEVFDRVWRIGHKSFKPERRTPGACPLASTRSWLTTITLRTIENILRRRSKVDPIDPVDNEDLFVEPPYENKVRHAISVQQLVQNALSETDAAIVWFKMRYYDPETGESQPPREELADFLAKHKLTDAAFRKRYSRAIQTLQAAEISTPLTTR